jgi:nucleotide-binding universal stress UspA family protein
MQTSKVSTPFFNKVLVATDLTAASRAAFQVALNICSDLGAELSVLHVYESGAVSPEMGDSPLESMGAHVKTEQSLADLINRARQLGVPCETLTKNGSVSLAILDTIASKEINLAIFGTKALHGFERAVKSPSLKAIWKIFILKRGRRATTAGRTLNGSLIVRERRSRIFEVHGGFACLAPQCIGVQVPSSAPIQKIEDLRKS